MGTTKYKVKMAAPARRAVQAAVYKPIIQEALRRLPKEELDARQFRLARANQLVMQKSVLPRDQWTDFDTDEPYLMAYIKEVEKELAKRKNGIPCECENRHFCCFLSMQKIDNC